MSFMDKWRKPDDEIKMPEPREEKRIKGKIIKINDKGYGFISSREMEFTRIFFHWTSLQQDTLRFPQLEIGMPVEFAVQEVPNKGVRALRIKVM